MGSLQLECPLCCSETFTCHNSLKYHLLSITDNLICPACGKRFERIFELAMHLGRECVDSERECVDSERETISEHDADIDAEINVKAFQIKKPSVVIKQEQSNDTKFNTLVNSSILAKALMKDTTEIKAEKKNAVVEVEEASDDDLYYCSSCRVNFTSIDQHLEEFHEGHEVYLEEDKEDSANKSLDENSEFVIDGEEDDDEDECDNDGTEIMQAMQSTELLNTVQEEECVDKDGRLYTRKVVKIEKFWDDKEDKTDEEGTTYITLNDDLTQNLVLENVEILRKGSVNNQDILEFYQCSKCELKYPNIQQYTKHKCLALESNSNKHKRCKICKACFINSKFLAAHMKLHKTKTTATGSPDPNPPYICEICNTEFSTFKSLRLHKRMHEPIKSKDIEPPVNYGMLGEELSSDGLPREMFICELCNKPYNKEYEEAHKKFHSNDIDFNCDICNRKFFTQENLDMHMRAHSDTKKFTCSYCKKAFLTKEKLEAHMLSKCQKRQYECQYCGRRFARPHEKVKHERIHTGEKPHVCEICGKSFRVSYCLTLHMRTHSGTRPYKCDHCGKRFKAHSVYNHHLLTHSDDRKYKCPYCPKTFKTGVQLAGHKNSHTKPFTCTECNRPFASLYAVRAHMETHQRQNNLKYKCWLCGASYARAFALRDHIREQHVGENANPTQADTVVLETDEYSITGNIEAHAPILVDADDNILIDIGTETVDNMEIPDVQVALNLQDSSDT